MTNQPPALPARVALGAVCNIRALPSREISQIMIELPEEFHVPLTMLAYGREVLVMRSPLADGTPLGVRSVDDLGSEAEAVMSDASDTTQLGQLVHGLVSLVRAVPSRMVTVLHIDIPSDQHVAVTTLLFGATCMVVPSKLPPGTKYGLVGAPSSSETPSAASTSRRGSPETERNLDRPQVHRGLGSPANTGPREPLKWVSARCQEKSFQAFVGASSEEEARQAVRDRCGMDSCSELNHRVDALRLFLRDIYHPYMDEERGRSLRERGRAPAAAPMPAQGSHAQASDEDFDGEEEGEPHPEDGDEDDLEQEERARATSPFSALVNRR